MFKADFPLVYFRLYSIPYKSGKLTKAIELNTALDGSVKFVGNNNLPENVECRRAKYQAIAKYNGHSYIFSSSIFS